jgi:hypothetical protein
MKTCDETSRAKTQKRQILPYLFSVAQTSKSAVPQVSKPAGRNAVAPTWKSAAQQVWKPALHAVHFRNTRDKSATQAGLSLTKSKPVKPSQS